MNRKYQSPAPVRRASLVSKTITALALIVLGTLAGCAYTQTMNERNLEGERLRSELEYERQRNLELSR